MFSLLCHIENFNVGQYYQTFMSIAASRDFRQFTGNCIDFIFVDDSGLILGSCLKVILFFFPQMYIHIEPNKFINI